MSSANKIEKGPIVVIGAGLSGLAAALEIEAQGESCVVLEAGDRIGGKLETTVVEENYRLDRGFQVLLPSYPEIQQLGDLSELDLKFFAAGARLETEEGTIRMADPLRNPEALFSTAFGTYGTLKDKWLVWRLQQSLRWLSPEAVLTTESLGGPAQSTLEFLKSYGFSESIISNFWRPFFAGIFLEKDLATSAGFFKYLVKMFSGSPVAVPKMGVGEFPNFLVRQLKTSEVRLSSRVRNVDAGKVHLENGSVIEARAVVRLTQGTTGDRAAGPFGVVTTLWFQAPEAPFEGPWLSLNSHRKNQQINHVAVLSNVSRDYALKGDALISVNVISKLPQGDISKVLLEAESLYGSSVKSWRLLRADVIDRPFPLYLGRSDSDTPSQQGALLRGRTAARQALKRL